MVTLCRGVFMFALMGLIILDACVLFSPPVSEAQALRGLYGVVWCSIAAIAAFALPMFVRRKNIFSE